jgi:hypothetical protein
MGWEDFTKEIEAFIKRWHGLDIESLMRVLKEGQGEDRVLAIFAVGKLRSPRSRELLLPFLRSSQPMERWASALELGRMKEEAAFPILLNMLTEFFPPKEWPSFEGDGLWIYNGWRLDALLLLAEWTRPDAIPSLLAALSGYNQLEQLIPESITTARRYWRQCQEQVMYTLGWLGYFEALPQMVKALSIVQPTLSSWRVFLALGSLHAHKMHPDILRRSIPPKSELREQVMAILQEQFGLSSEEQERCLDYYKVQRLW